jgi:hypothetical protein
MFLQSRHEHYRLLSLPTQSVWGRVHPKFEVCPDTGQIICQNCGQALMNPASLLDVSQGRQNATIIDRGVQKQESEASSRWLAGEVFARARRLAAETSEFRLLRSSCLLGVCR